MSCDGAWLPLPPSRFSYEPYSLAYAFSRKITHISLGSLHRAKSGEPSASHGTSVSTVMSIHSPNEYSWKVTKPLSSSAAPDFISFFSSPPVSPLCAAAAIEDMAPSR